MVSGMVYRHPAVLANMAATLDITSGGRLELGVGAAWNAEECMAYGIELGTIRERCDRFAEGLEVIRLLLSQPTSNFSGEYFQLKDAHCNPKPVQASCRSASAAAARGAPCRSLPSTQITGTSARRPVIQSLSSD